MFAVIRSFALLVVFSPRVQCTARVAGATKWDAICFILLLDGSSPKGEWREIDDSYASIYICIKLRIQFTFSPYALLHDVPDGGGMNLSHFVVDFCKDAKESVDHGMKIEQNIQSKVIR